jgi:hypothetical protein
MRSGPDFVSFHNWSEADPLPSFDDDITGFDLFSEGCFPAAAPVFRPLDHPEFLLILSFKFLRPSFLMVYRTSSSSQVR